MKGTCIQTRVLSGAGEGRLAGLFRELRTRALRLLSDEFLLARAREGDAKAFDALVARHRNRLRTLGLDSLQSSTVAGRALSEMVLKAFHNLDCVGATRSPGMWLYLHGFRVVFRRADEPERDDGPEPRSSAGRELVRAGDHAATPRS